MFQILYAISIQKSIQGLMRISPKSCTIQDYIIPCILSYSLILNNQIHTDFQVLAHKGL